jgi:hypothetical protein
MRRALPLLTLAVALLAAAPADARRAEWPQPGRYSAELRWHEKTSTLTGSERIGFQNDGPRPLQSVWLRVWPNGYGSCAHPLARVVVVSGGHAGGWGVRCTALRVRLARPVGPGRQGELRVRLQVKVPHRSDRFGQDGGVVYLGNALPLLAVDEAPGPALDPYTELGDPFYSLSASWSVRFDFPARLTAATTGVTTHRAHIGHAMKRIRVEAPQARDFAMVLGRFSVATVRTGSGVLLRRYSARSSERRAAKVTLDVARAAIDTYTYWYGSPGVSEIDVLPGPRSLGGFGTGMEFPGLVLTPDVAQTIAHELAHQWWYSLVGDDQWRSPWLDEAFAEYSARRLPASVVGPDDLHCDDADPVRSAGGSGPLTRSMSHWDSAGGDEYYRSVYLGGTCALRLLEDRIGPDAMTAFLRGYADSHRFGVTTTADFISALRAAAPTGFDVDAYLKRARIAGP